MTAERDEKREQIKRFLPHREPMILLDEALCFTDDQAKMALTITPDSPFYNKDLQGVPSWVGIEYMAQAISAWSGSQRLAEGEPISIGFLLGTRRYQCEQASFKNGSSLIVTVTVCYVDDSGLSSFDCTIEKSTAGELNNEKAAVNVLAQARINAFRPDDPRKFVRGL